MSEIGSAFCPNENCKDYGLRNHGNITVRGKYGKDKTRDLLYCKTCGKRFASTRGTAFFGLHISDETIGQIIHHAAEGVGPDGHFKMPHLWPGQNAPPPYGCPIEKHARG